MHRGRKRKHRRRHGTIRAKSSTTVPGANATARNVDKQRRSSQIEPAGGSGWIIHPVSRLPSGVARHHAPSPWASPGVWGGGHGGGHETSNHGRGDDYGSQTPPPPKVIGRDSSPTLFWKAHTRAALRGTERGYIWPAGAGTPWPAPLLLRITTSRIQTPSLPEFSNHATTDDKKSTRKNKPRPASSSTTTRPQTHLLVHERAEVWHAHDGVLVRAEQHALRGLHDVMPG